MTGMLIAGVLCGLAGLCAGFLVLAEDPALAEIHQPRNAYKDRV